MVLGLLLICAALVLVLRNYRQEETARESTLQAVAAVEEARKGRAVPDYAEDKSTEKDPEEERPEEEKLPDYILHPGMEMPVLDVNGTEYIGTLVIPSLNLELPVISEWSYEALETAPCRFSGSAYRDDFVIIAHNYDFHFGKVRNLSTGDLAVFQDISGNFFYYEMAEKEVLQPTDAEKLTQSGDALTLLTCTPGGRTRDTVRFTRAENEEAAGEYYRLWASENGDNF